MPNIPHPRSPWDIYKSESRDRALPCGFVWELIKLNNDYVHMTLWCCLVCLVFLGINIGRVQSLHPLSPLRMGRSKLDQTAPNQHQHQGATLNSSEASRGSWMITPSLLNLRPDAQPMVGSNGWASNKTTSKMRWTNTVKFFFYCSA